MITWFCEFGHMRLSALTKPVFCVHGKQRVLTSKTLLYTCMTYIVYAFRSDFFAVAARLRHKISYFKVFLEDANKLPASLMESGCPPFSSLHVCIQAKYPLVLFYFVLESASPELKAFVQKQTNKHKRNENNNNKIVLLQNNRTLNNRQPGLSAIKTRGNYPY